MFFGLWKGWRSSNNLGSGSNGFQGLSKSLQNHSEQKMGSVDDGFALFRGKETPKGWWYNLIENPGDCFK